jgi:hypothetical protein
MVDKLDESNFLLYAAKHYDNPGCFDTLEFYEDLNRFKYIKRLLNRYRETGEMKERLVINHLIILNNVFGVKHSLRMLFLKLDGYHDLLAPFLTYMNVLPAKIENIGVQCVTIDTSTIKPDQTIVNILKAV